MSAVHQAQVIPATQRVATSGHDAADADVLVARRLLTRAEPRHAADSVGSKTEQVSGSVQVAVGRAAVGPRAVGHVLGEDAQDSWGRSPRARNMRRRTDRGYPRTPAACRRRTRPRARRCWARRSRWAAVLHQRIAARGSTAGPSARTGRRTCPPTRTGRVVHVAAAIGDAGRLAAVVDVEADRALDAVVDPVAEVTLEGAVLARQLVARSGRTWPRWGRCRRPCSTRCTSARPCSPARTGCTRRRRHIAVREVGIPPVVGVGSSVVPEPSVVGVVDRLGRRGVLVVGLAPVDPPRSSPALDPLHKQGCRGEQRDDTDGEGSTVSHDKASDQAPVRQSMGGERANETHTQ
jgi:hypothetical protein